MSGTIFGLGLSQQADEKGRPISGGLLYLYQANTSTPVSTYSDVSLASVQAWPLTLDAAGRVPAFWVNDGSYRVRLTTSAGVEVFDEQSVTAIGASSGGSSGSVSQDTTTLHQTGDLIWSPVSGTRSGWVRANGRTIGGSASGATERANSDTQSLFEYLWTNFSNSFCAVSGGRGASATADFNAGKAIATLDMRSKGIFGLDDMGNSSVGVTGASTIAATAVGASTYTIALANLPATTLSHSLTVNTTISSVSGGAQAVVVKDVNTGTNSVSKPSSTTVIDSVTPITTTLVLQSSLLSGNIDLGGSGTDMDILTPMRVGTWYIKL